MGWILRLTFHCCFVFSKCLLALISTLFKERKSPQTWPLWVCHTVVFHTLVWAPVFVTSCFLLALSLRVILPQEWLARFSHVSSKYLLGLSFPRSQKEDCLLQKEKLCFATVPLIGKKIGIRRQVGVCCISKLAAKATDSHMSCRPAIPHTPT